MSHTHRYTQYTLTPYKMHGLDRANIDSKNTHCLPHAAHMIPLTPVSHALSADHSMLLMLK